MGQESHVLVGMRNKGISENFSSFYGCVWGNDDRVSADLEHLDDDVTVLSEEIEEAVEGRIMYT